MVCERRSNNDASRDKVGNNKVHLNWHIFKERAERKLLNFYTSLGSNNNNNYIPRAVLTIM